MYLSADCLVVHHVRQPSWRANDQVKLAAEHQNLALLQVLLLAAEDAGGPAAEGGGQSARLENKTDTVGDCSRCNCNSGWACIKRLFQSFSSGL